MIREIKIKDVKVGFSEAPVYLGSRSLKSSHVVLSFKVSYSKLLRPVKY